MAISLGIYPIFRQTHLKSVLQGLDCAIEQDLHGVARRLKALEAAVLEVESEVPPTQLRSISVDWDAMWGPPQVCLLVYNGHEL